MDKPKILKLLENGGIKGGFIIGMVKTPRSKYMETVSHIFWKGPDGVKKRGLCAFAYGSTHVNLLSPRGVCRLCLVRLTRLLYEEKIH